MKILKLKKNLLLIVLIATCILFFYISKESIIFLSGYFRKDKIEMLPKVNKQGEVSPAMLNVVTDTTKYLTAELVDPNIVTELGGRVHIRVRTNLKHWNTEVILGSDFAEVSRKITKTEDAVEFITTVIFQPFQPISNVNEMRLATIQFSGKGICLVNLNINQQFEKKYIIAIPQREILWIGGTTHIKVKTNLDSWSIDKNNIRPKNADCFVTFMPTTGGKGETDVIMTSTLNIPMTFTNIKFKGISGNHQIDYSIIIKQDFIRDK